MVIREVGLLFRGYTLINVEYHHTGEAEIDVDLRSGMLTAILNFAENTFSKNIEYLEGNKFVISFFEDKIIHEEERGEESLLAYAILDKEKKIDKYMKNVIRPILKESIKNFETEIKGKNLSEISQFKSFKQKFDKILGTSTKKVDEKLEGIFYTKD